MMGSVAGSVLILLYFGLILLVLWLVISSFRKIAIGIEDIASTLRRIESSLNSTRDSQ